MKPSHYLHLFATDGYYNQYGPYDTIEDAMADATSSPVIEAYPLKFFWTSKYIILPSAIQRISTKAMSKKILSYFIGKESISYDDINTFIKSI